VGVVDDGRPIEFKGTKHRPSTGTRFKHGLKFDIFVLARTAL
jgi:hypothetical protein